MPSQLSTALLFGGIAALMTAYGVGRLIAFTHMTALLKVAATAFVSLAAASHFLLLASETDFTPETLGNWVPVTALFVTMGLLFFLLTLVRDIVVGIRALIRRAKGLPAAGRDLFSLFAACIVMVLALVFSVIGTWNALSEPYPEEMTVGVKRLPAELKGLRIVQISDLHASPLFPRERTETVVRLVNEAKPDLVLLTGDFADGDAERRRFDLEPLAGIKSTYGVFAVMGNHEYISDPSARAELIGSLGIRLLTNSAVTLEVKGRRVTVAGITDPAAARRGLEGPDLGKALSGASADDLRILMAHRPGDALKNSDPSYGIDLQLSGHTHGGQMGLFSGLIASMNGGFVQGLYKLGSMTLCVTRGAALWPGLPVRISSWNEIPVITLTSE